MEDNKPVLDEDYKDDVSVKSVATKWGLILGIISIAFFLIIVFGGLVGSKSAQWIGYIPAIIVIILAHKEFKKEGDGFMSYGKGLGIGTLTAFIGSLISTAFFYVYVKFVDGSFIEIIKDRQLDEFQNQGMTEQQIDQAVSMSEAFMTPELLSVFSLLGALFFGFILSLIISAFTKNSNPDFDA